MNQTLASPSRRHALKTAGLAAAAVAAPALISTRAYSQSLKKITFAWNANAFCLTPIVAAQEHGFFEKNGLSVDLVNYTGSTDQLLETLATGKADAAVGMIHRWLKPLESGFDVKIISSSHGGCQRVAGVKAAGVEKLADVKGKTIGVSDLNSPGKNWFAIYLKKNGIDPDADVQWRQYPADLLYVAASKGEIQVIADGDPTVWLLKKNNPGKLTDLATNLSGEYADKTCCVIGARGELVRNDRKTVAGVARAIVQASDWVADNPNESAKLFARYAPKISVEDLQALLGTLTHHNHPTGQALRDTVTYYANDFRVLNVLKATTDPKRFADHVVVDVLA
jgi:NitT/TauT family transport system substrate-binding protein